MNWIKREEEKKRLLATMDRLWHFIIIRMHLYMYAFLGSSVDFWCSFTDWNNNHSLWVKFSLGIGTNRTQNRTEEEAIEPSTKNYRCYLHRFQCKWQIGSVLVHEKMKCSRFLDPWPKREQEIMRIAKCWVTHVRFANTLMPIPENPTFYLDRNERRHLPPRQ